MARGYSTAGPPSRLVRISEGLSHPAIAQAGVTKTRDGHWALLVRLRKGIRTPVPEVERQRAAFPVVYEPEPDVVPIARPAYPRHGE